MARRPSLSEPSTSLQKGDKAEQAVEKALRTPSRQGKRGVAFWLVPEAFQQLRSLAFEEDRSIQAIMEESLDMFFASRGKHRLATQQS